VVRQAETGCLFPDQVNKKVKNTTSAHLLIGNKKLNKEGGVISGNAYWHV